MSKRDEHFVPEQVDEQIDALTQLGKTSPSPTARLVANLRVVYQEDEEIVKQVWTRLAQPDEERRRTNARQRNAQDQLLSIRREGPQKRKHFRWLETLAAVLVVGILVGSLAFLFESKQSLSGSAGPSTSTPHMYTPTPGSPSATSGSSGLYLTTSDGIDRIDRSTGKLVWHVGSGLISSLLVEGGIVIFSGGNTISLDYSNYYVEAVDVVSGHQLWRKAYGTVYDLQGANGMIAVSSCRPAPTNSPSAAPCTIDGLKTSNGQRLWSHPSAQGTIWERYQNGVIYGISYTDFFALHLANGTPLWQNTLQKYPSQEASSTPFISGTGLYFASCNSTKQTAGYGTCDLFAFNAINGAELWHALVSNSWGLSAAIPTVMDGVVYVASAQGTIYAFNAATGTPLWTYHAGGLILNPLLSSQGLLYAEVGVNNTTAHLLALKVIGSSYSVGWSQTLHLPAGTPPSNPTILENNLIYILNSNNDILAFQADNGEQGPDYHPPVSAPIGSFMFVS